jgi:hypothetical protein
MKIFYLLTIFLLPVLQANSQLNKSSFYAALASGNVAEIETQLNLAKAQNTGENIAYEGALLMKKAGLAGKPKEKLRLFREGRSKLESSINSNSGNIEYRFLRLIIQEHAPKIVKYRNNLEEDSQLIQSHFKSLAQPLQQAITDYSKQSKILKLN